MSTSSDNDNNTSSAKFFQSRLPSKNDSMSSSRDRWMDKIENLQIPRSEVNKLIMNYLVTEGFKDAAEKFQVESGTDTGIDLKTLDQRIQILESIQAGDIQNAVHMINSYQPHLLDDNRYLFFHLQQQHLIELIRQRNIDAALAFAQQNLSDQGESHPSVLEELERTMALLAFEDPESSPFGDLLALSHRQKVASELNAAFLAQQDGSQGPSISKLAYLLKFILWAQEELDRKKVKYPYMSDLATASIEDSK